MSFSTPFPGPFSVPFPAPFHGMPAPVSVPRPPLEPTPMPEANLPRALNYYADVSGCGHWRMIWPEHILNAHQKLLVHGSTVMCFDPRFFTGTKAIRIQRQATESQLMFVKFLRELSNQLGFKIIYEIDDIVFHEDIPDYNKFKTAFVDPKIRAYAQEMMSLADEITVTCQYMKEYYQSKTGNSRITVIPNFPPRFWMGHYYNPEKIKANYVRHCCGKNPRPRILYSGSGAHFDVENRVNQADDFEHVRNAIAKTSSEFQWVFLGAFPLPLQDLVKNGTLEYHQWSRLYDYPKKIASLNCNMMIAPLQNNVFNCAKSDLKLIEAGCYGIPIVCQDIATYKEAPLKFTTGDEMIDQIKRVIKSPSLYYSYSKIGNALAESRYLENDDNIDQYVELYTTEYKSPARKLLSKLNP